MSGQRRKGFTHASQLVGPKGILAWMELEKLSYLRDENILRAGLPIVRGEADIVVPKRNRVLFQDSYPPFQVASEDRGNRMFNTLLRRVGLRDQEDEDLDVWFGPKLFINDPKIVEHFMLKYNFNKRGLDIDHDIEPELWANAIFLPIVNALRAGLRIQSVEVPFEYPPKQKAIETNNADMVKKRNTQLRAIIRPTIHYETLLQPSLICPLSTQLHLPHVVHMYLELFDL
jgi:hypothetical protein